MKKTKFYLNNSILLLVLITIFFSTIAFSALNKELSISGDLAYRVKANIRITDLRLYEAAKSIETFKSNFSKEQNIIGVDLSNSDSQITYAVEITNFSDKKMGVFQITGLPENLTYELTDYTIKSSICASDGNCLAGAVKTFKITIKYKDPSKFDASNTKYNFKLHYDFRPMYTVTYRGFKNVDSLPKEVIEGDTLNVNFAESVSKDNLYVTVGEQVRNDFTVSSNIFSLSNITDNVVISKFIFNVEVTNKNVVFPRTTPVSEIDNILTTDTTFNITIKNNDGTNVSLLDTNYKIEVLNSSKFALATAINKTIAGGTKTDEVVPIALKISNLEDPTKKFTLRVTTTSPITKTFDIEFTVTQEGAIQTIEDLVALSLAIRGKSNPYNLNATQVQSQRFALTRNLDFTSTASYEQANRTDFADVNDDATTNTLYNELTKEPGFLPIGELAHPFSGVLNGKSHTLSNLLIHKSKQVNIGLFGYTSGATIKNLNITGGDILNHNQTAGMLIGKMNGGSLENINITNGKVVSEGSINTNQDTYAGGVVGYITNGASLTNCINYATVSCSFSGDVNAYSGPAGGIAAWMSHSTLDGCKNYGTITGESYVGGILGFSGMQLDSGGNGGGTVRNCENRGNIAINYSGAKNIGGIAGYNKAGGTITTSKNYGNVQGGQYVGGLVGYNYGSVTNCSNYSSTVTGSSYVSKTIGRQSSSGSSSGNNNYG